MPLSFGKIGAFIALFTIGAFILWLLVTSFFASETVEEDAAPTGAIELDGGTAG
ncbi:MAG: hypothetical protein ACOYB4_04825 [Methyloceanibacter sp.]